MARWLIVSTAFAWAFLTAQPACIAQENQPGLDAALAIWRYIFEIDATLEICRRVDDSNAQSYYPLGQKFHNRVDNVMINVNHLLLVAGERTNRGKEFMDAAHGQKKTVGQEIVRTATENPEDFRSRCRTLPEALAARSEPFQPLDQKFSAEKKLMQNWAVEMNLISKERLKEIQRAAETEPEEKASCENQGGKWGPLGGLANQTGCNIPYSDGGKTCSDSRQCQGECIVEDDLVSILKGKPVKEFRPGQPVTGICTSWRIMFGCFTYVRKGKVVPGLCID
jgi:hypothetical protein